MTWTPLGAVLLATTVRDLRAPSVPACRVRSRMRWRAVTGVRASRYRNGSVNLQTADIRGGLFCRCKMGRRPLLRNDVHARGARIATTTDFSGAYVRGELLLEGTSLDGPVYIRDGWLATDGGLETKKNDPNRHRLSPKICKRIQLTYARINGTLQFHRAAVGSASLKGATVSGSVLVVACDVRGDLNFSSATVGSDVVIRAQKCTLTQTVTRTLVGGSIRAEASWLQADVRFLGADITGDIDIGGTQISGSVEFGGVPEEAKATGTTGKKQNSELGVEGELSLAGARIGGSLEASGLKVVGGIALPGAQVRGTVDLRGAILRNGSSPPAAGVPLATDGSAPIAEASTSTTTNAASAPELTAPAAAMPKSGPKSLRRPVTPPGVALHAVGATIGAALCLNEMSACGNVDLRHARIGAGLFAGKMLHDETTHPQALNLTGAFLLDAARVTGTVDFRDAHVGNELSLERTFVEGKLLCPLPVSTVGPNENVVDLRNATIRELELHQNGTTPATSLDKAKLKDRVAELVGRVCNAFKRRTQPAPAPNDGRLKFEGCGFQELVVPDGDYARLLDAFGTSDSRSSFAIERWLRNRGEDDKAERVYTRAQEIRRRSRSWLGKAGDWAVAALRRVSLAFEWLIVASVLGFALSTVVFSSPRSVLEEEERSMQTQPLTTSIEGAPSRAVQPPVNWGWGDAALFAAHTHLPMLTLPSDPKMRPSKEAIAPQLLITLRFDAYATFIALLSYAVVPLMIGGIVSTWLERRRQA